jgi:uncharacterized protein (PEP-CTERM system associated)
VSLAPDETKQDEWVTQLIPGISLTGTGSRLRLSANYAPQFTYYGQGQTSKEVYQKLSASANAELAEQLLFLDAVATVDQYDVSLRGPLTTSNVNTTGNRATASTLLVSPYLRRNFGSAVAAEARYTYTAWKSDDDISPTQSVGDRVDLRVASGPAYTVLTWELTYLREKFYYDEDSSQADTDSEVTTARLRRVITATVGLLARAAYENYDYRVLGPGAGGSAWGIGFDWTPTPRTQLTAIAGERFYGDSYFLDFRHRTRLTAWRAGYSEEITSARSQFFLPATTSTSSYLDALYSSQFPDPAAREKAVEEFIARTGLPPSLAAPVNFYTNQLFLLKKWHASVGLLGIRNSLIADVFKDTREALPGNLALTGSGDFAVSDTIRQTGGSIVWNHQLSSRSALSIDGAYSRVEFLGSDRIDRYAYGGVGLTRQLQLRMFGSLSYRRNESDSNLGTEYKENSVVATLQMRF